MIITAPQRQRRLVPPLPGPTLGEKTLPTLSAPTPVTFCHDTGTLAVQVTRISDRVVLWFDSISGVPDFENLVHFGASAVGLNYAPGATGIGTIDNVRLYESAPGSALGPSIRVSQVEICWPSQTNVAYNVLYSSSLTPNVWLDLVTNVVGTAGQTCVQDAIPPGSPRRFYRVQVAQ